MEMWAFEAISAAGSVLSGVAAAVAVFYAAAQVRTGNRDRRAQQAREVDGVSVSWLPLEVPDHPDDDGMAQWLYEFRIDNPARLPIDSVRATVHFPVPVRRIRYSSRVEDPSTTLELDAPVIPAHGHRVWKRRLLLPFEADSVLRTTRAEVTFSTVSGERPVNHWPKDRSSAGTPE